MKNTTKILGMTAAVALLSAPAMAHKSKKIDLDSDGYAETTVKYSDSKSVFHRLDANHDDRITMEEFKDNTMHDNEAGVFKMYDQNNDGYVTRTELYNNSKMGGMQVKGDKKTVTNLRSASGQPVGSIDQKYYGHIDNPFYDDPELVNDVDYDIDNPFVDDPELANDVNWNWPERIDRSKPLFPQLDTDNSGYLSLNEFENGTIHDNEAEVFAMLDKNQSGYVSKYEFKSFDKTGGRK